MSVGASLTKNSPRFGTISNAMCSVSALKTISRDGTSGDDHKRSTYMAILGSKYLGGGRPHQALVHTNHNNAKRNIERVLVDMGDGPVHTQALKTRSTNNDSCATTKVGKLLMEEEAAQMIGQQLRPEFRQNNYTQMYPPSHGRPSKETAHVRIVQNRPKPECWEHGCNGRQFSTFSNLLRHQREKSGQTTKASCPNCGAEFTRLTARNGHLLHDKCRSRRES